MVTYQTCGGLSYTAAKPEVLINHDIIVLYLIMIHLLTAIGLTPVGSSTVHIYTQTVHRTTQLTTITTQLTTEQHNKTQLTRRGKSAGHALSLRVIP
jgi:uncharacterized integral membrane protein